MKSFLPSSRSRRGVAFVISIGLLALLGTYLIAAQTSVVNTARKVKNSQLRQERAAEINSLLELAYAAAADLARDGFEKTIEVPADLAEGVTVTLESLNQDSLLFAERPGLGFREGDALVRIVWDQQTVGAVQPHSYLINVDGQRPGAIRVR